MSTISDSDLRTGQRWRHHSHGPAIIAALGYLVGNPERLVTVRWENRPELRGTFSEFRSYPVMDFFEFFDSLEGVA